MNYVRAYVTCTECARTDIWKDKNYSQCKVCGPNRVKNWSAADGVDPLSSFMEWILYGLDKEYPTYAYSHYGKN